VAATVIVVAHWVNVRQIAPVSVDVVAPIGNPASIDHSYAFSMED
jgi:hypothetical protein